MPHQSSAARWRWLRALAAFVLLFTSFATVAQPAQAVSPDIVISQVYGGGGNSGATFKNDFIELYNRGASAVDVTDWSVQYASATGTTWQSTSLTGTIQPGQYYLIGEAAGTGGTVDLPSPNATGNIAMSATSGKVALVTSTTSLSCGANCSSSAGVRDFVGYGTAGDFEGSGPTPTLSNTTAALRKGNGATDTDNNSADFTVGSPNPGHTPNLTINDVSLNEGNSGTTSFSFTLSLSSPAGAGGVTFDIATADDTATSPGDYDAKSLTGQTIPAGSTSYTFDVLVNGDTTLEPNETFFVNVTNVTGATIGDGQGQGTIQNDDAPTQPPPGSVVISEVYGGGGNSGATYTNDFIELYNRTGSTISLVGWSVQYASAAGTSWQVTALTGSIAPGKNYLVQEAAGAGGTTPLPTPNATGNINMSATAGKVALVNSTTALSAACPASASIVDLVGYGSTANCFEGSGPTPAPSNTTSVLRAGNGTTDTDNNAADFSAGAPDPRNSADQAPTVSSTTPANGAVGVALNANIVLNFSEPVNVTGSWFTISCANSGAHTATATGGPTSFTLDPDTDLASSEVCTVTVVANQVTDQDTDDPPDAMTADYVFSFTTAEVLVCGDPATFIHDIQGSGAQSALVGQTKTIEGIVVGDYQGSDQFSGFHIQEEDSDADGDPATSEGIFVFNNSFPVSVGDKVRLKGTVSEFNTSGVFLTELINLSALTVCSSGNSVTPANITLPVSNLSDWERYEGMLINIPQDLTATETFTLGRFGEVSLSVNGRLRNPTNIVAPGAPAIAQQGLNDRSRILLDDGNGQQNIDPTIYPPGGLSASNTLRSGYTVHGLTGVLEQRFGVYRVQPVGPVGFDASTNPRTPAPSPVGGNLKVAALNVLNFFTTLDTGSPICGPTGGLDCRGANSAFEFTRQRDKIINAILAIDPDIAGLMEVQNDASATIQNLVDGLNAVAGAGTYAYINTGTIGTDAIKVAMIYKPAVVSPVGSYAILNSSVDPLFIDTKNRPSLAQTFIRNANGAKLTVVVNHLKSKGSDCNDVGDPDTGDGQGNCNLTRTKAATALVNWLATDPTGSGDPDFLIVGDMNSYAKEDPITTIKSAGYTNLIESIIGANAYSYVFDGQSGYLDHALASASLTAQTSGVAEWHNNADEPTVLDYNVEFKTANQINTFYSSEPYRASDHDPVVVGLNLVNTAPVASNDSYQTAEDTTLTVAAPGVLGNDTDSEGNTLTAILESGPAHGALTLNANGSFTYIPATNYHGPDSFSYKANDGNSGSNVATVSITVNSVNDDPVAVDDSLTVAKNSSGAVVALANDSDVDGDTLTVTSYTQPAHGTVKYSAKNNNFRYTPNKGFSGTDAFTYTISDGNGGTDTATVTVTVQ